MGSHSNVQRGRQVREFSDIKGVCGHSGGADKIGEENIQLEAKLHRQWPLPEKLASLASSATS
jgi:hypothetical protein